MTEGVADNAMCDHFLCISGHVRFISYGMDTSILLIRIRINKEI